MANQNIRPKNIKLQAQQKPDKAMQDIDLYHLLTFYANKWIWIVLLTIIGSIAGFVYSNYIQTPLYKSDATLLLISPADKVASGDTTLINNYIELFKSRRVLEPVIKGQKLDISYDDLVNSIEATNSKNTEVIKIAITTTNPKTSKSLVEGAVASFKGQISKLYDLDNIQVVDNANLATEPYNVHVVMSTAISATTGFVISIITLFFIYDFNLGKDNQDNSKKNKVKKDIPKKVIAEKVAVKKKKVAKTTFTNKIANILTRSTNNNRAKKTVAKKVSPKKPATNPKTKSKNTRAKKSVNNRVKKTITQKVNGKTTTK